MQIGYDNSKPLANISISIKVYYSSTILVSSLSNKTMLSPPPFMAFGVNVHTEFI